MEFNYPATDQTPPVTFTPPPSGNGGLSTAVIVDIVVPIITSIVLFILGFSFLRRKAKKQQTVMVDSTENSASEDLSDFHDSGNNNEAMVMERKNSLGKKDNKCKVWHETCKVGGNSKVMEEHSTEIECFGQLQISSQNSQVMESVQESTVTKTEDNDAENSASEDLSDDVSTVDLEDLSDLVRKVELESHPEKESNADAKMSSVNSEKSGDPLILSQQLDDFVRNSGTPIVRTQEHKKNSLKFWCGMCEIGTDTEEVMKIHRTGKKHLANKKSLARFWCDVCQIGADTEEVMEKHLKGKKHLSGLQQVNQNSLKFWCEMCQIGTDTKKVMKIHERGKKHLAHKKSLLRFWCDVCQIGADTEEVMEMHWKGKKHLSQFDLLKGQLIDSGINLSVFDISIIHKEKEGVKLIKWLPPPLNFWKLNVDGGSRGNPGNSGGGGVLRNANGNWVFAFRRFYGHQTSLVAEMRALLDGLLLCHREKIVNIHIETDSQELLAIVKNGKGPWYTSLLMKQIRHLISLCQARIDHIYREGNAVADKLANIAMDDSTTQDYVIGLASPPASVLALIALEKHGCHYIRIN